MIECDTTRNEPKAGLYGYGYLQAEKAQSKLMLGFADLLEETLDEIAALWANGFKIQARKLAMVLHAYVQRNRDPHWRGCYMKRLTDRLLAIESSKNIDSKGV